MISGTAEMVTSRRVQKIPLGKRGPQIVREPEGVKLTPIELTVHQQRLAAENATARAIDLQELAVRAKRSGMKRRRVRAEDGSVKEVWSFAASYHAMGFQDHQTHAAERFGRDWEVAYRMIKGQGFEFGVDGGRSPHKAHFSQVDAQSRLAACQQYLGRRAFDIVSAIAIYGATIRELAPRAHTHDRNIRQEVENAFNDLDAFYTGDRRKDGIWEAVEKFNAERAAMIAKGEREVG